MLYRPDDWDAALVLMLTVIPVASVAVWCVVLPECRHALAVQPAVDRVRCGIMAVKRESLCRCGCGFLPIPLTLQSGGARKQSVDEVDSTT